MRAQDQSGPTIQFSRNRFTFRLGFDAGGLALLGGLMFLIFLAAARELGPDQVAEIFVCGIWLLPLALVLDLGLGLLFFLPLYRNLAPLSQEEELEAETAQNLWKQLLTFPLKSLFISGGMWLLWTVFLGVWMVRAQVFSGLEAGLVLPGCALLGMSTSVVYYFRCRSQVRGVLRLLSPRLPRSFSPPAPKKLWAKLMPAFIFLVLAVGISVALLALNWRERAAEELVLSLVRQRLEAMSGENPAAVREEEIGPVFMRTFVVDREGAVKAGKLLPAEKNLLLRRPRLLGRREWEEKNPFRASVAGVVSRILRWPEWESLAAEAWSGKRWLIVLRSPGEGGLHPGAVVEWRREFFPAEPLGLLTGFLLLAFGLTVLWAVWFFREVSEPLSEVGEAVKDLAEEKSSVRVAVLGEDELGNLAAAFNQMSGKLVREMKRRAQALRGLQNAALTLSPLIQRLAQIVSDQAAGAAEQAVSLHEISTTSEEIAATLRTIAENAAQVEEVAGQSLNSCHQGQGQLQEVITSMDQALSRTQEIAHKMLSFQEQANRIESILGFLQEISERINLIALNAAIEAGSAGEGGDRFGIIAGEMRKLAELTLSGTKEIQGLFADLHAATSSAIIATEEGEKQVKAARGQADHTAESFQLIIHWASETARAAHEISISSNQQTTATDHLAAALVEVREVASRSAEAAKSLEDSIRELESIGEELNQLLAEPSAGKQKLKRPGADVLGQAPAPLSGMAVPPAARVKLDPKTDLVQ